MQVISSTQAYLSGLIGMIPDASLIFNSEREIIQWNQGAVELFGYQPEEILGKPATVLSPPDLEDEFCYFDQILQTEGKIRGIETIRLKKDGTEVNVSLSSSRIIAHSGDPVGTLVIFQDISGHKKIEKNLGNELMLNTALTDLAGSLMNPDVSLSEVCTLVLQYAIILTGSIYGVIAASKNPFRNDPHLAIMDVGEEGWPFLDITSLPIRKMEDLTASDSEIMGGYYLNLDPLGGGQDPLAFRILIVPVWIDGKLVGRIGLADPTTPYSEKDRSTAIRIGDFCALAIRRILDRDRIIEALKEKEILLTEVHHRVKNNMQIISSLLAMQSKQIDDTALRDLFLESHNRIQSIAKVHELLYVSGNHAFIEFDQFLKKLLFHLSDFYKSGCRGIAMIIRTDQVQVPISHAIPLSLIANELITNVFKYAFPDQKNGKIWVDLVSGNIPGSGILSVRDNGVGIPDGMVPEDISSIGMRLVTGLTEQIAGEYEFHTEKPGFQVIIRFNSESLHESESGMSVENDRPLRM